MLQIIMFRWVDKPMDPHQMDPNEFLHSKFTPWIYQSTGQRVSEGSLDNEKSLKVA